MLHFAGALHGLYAGEREGSEGQGLVEYALILAFVALLVIVALIFLRQQIQSGYSRIGNSIPTS